MKFWSNIMLIMAAFIWGAQTVLQKLATKEIPAAAFYGGRCVMGIIVMSFIACVVGYLNKKKAKEQGIELPKHDKGYFLDMVKAAPLVVLTNVAGNTLVQAGLFYTNASKGAFLNAIYIIFVPVLGFLIFRKKTSVLTWIGTVLAVIGLYFMCMTGDSFVIQKGDLMILSATLFFASHILLLSKYVQKFEGLHFAILEFIMAGAICLTIGFVFQHATFEMYMNCIPNLLFCGIGGIGICYALQVTAQKYTDPTVAALLMSLESVFASISGCLFLHERFTGREAVGIIFICAAIVLAQLPTKEERLAKKVSQS